MQANIQTIAFYISCCFLRYTEDATGFAVALLGGDPKRNRMQSWIALAQVAPNLAKAMASAGVSELKDVQPAANGWWREEFRQVLAEFKNAVVKLTSAEELPMDDMSSQGWKAQVWATVAEHLAVGHMLEHMIMDAIEQAVEEAEAVAARNPHGFSLN